MTGGGGPGRSGAAGAVGGWVGDRAGLRGGRLKKKAGMMQSLRMALLRRRLDIGVETCQSAAALTESRMDSDQWPGQWRVSAPAVQLIK